MRNFIEGYADLSESSKLLHISISWKKSNYSRLNGNQVIRIPVLFLHIAYGCVGGSSQEKELFFLNIRSAFLQFRISSFHGVFRAALEYWSQFSITHGICSAKLQYHLRQG